VSSIDFSKYFPFSSIRKEQQESLEFAIDVIKNQKKRFIVLELGTGCGKSAIGIALSRWISDNIQDLEPFKPGCYVLTTQKILQQQYMNDFGAPKGALTTIKSSSNYKCSYHKDMTCGESFQLLKNEEQGTRFWNNCAYNCHYKRDKRLFVEALEGVTNYSYFITETKFRGTLPPRNLLVLDECHNIENELSKLIEITVSEKFARDTLKLSWPEQLKERERVEWLKDEYAPAVSEKLQKINENLEQMNLKEKIKDFHAIVKTVDMLEKHLGKINEFTQMWSDDNWVMNEIPPVDKSLRKIEFKPVDIGLYSEDMLFRSGRFILAMSATVVNHNAFCQFTGIPLSDAAFHSIDSPFPIENRPVYFAPVGNMGQQTIEESLPKLVEMVKLILDQHKTEKGIIHCQTYRIANYIKQHVKSRRLLLHDPTSRDAIIEKHITSKSATVILSPSMAEGVDLRDDLSRFQIICKLPYPYLGDKLVKKRMNKRAVWYSYQTAKTIVQAAGRSIRSHNDHAVTYILDDGWRHFFEKNASLFPESFKKALKR
jgi:Rad3-related DNA helicase